MPYHGCTIQINGFLIVVAVCGKLLKRHCDSAAAPLLMESQTKHNLFWGSDVH